MGFDWEEILDAEGADLADAYEDSVARASEQDAQDRQETTSAADEYDDDPVDGSVATQWGVPAGLRPSDD